MEAFIGSEGSWPSLKPVVAVKVMAWEPSILRPLVEAGSEE
jgi:hypothetical protein